MMSELATRNPAQGLIDTLRREDFKEQIQIALPPSVTPDKFVRVATTAIMANGDLVAADRESLIRSLIQCAQMGLMPDGNEAALVIFNSKVKTPQGEQWVKKVQLLAMVGGYRKIAAEHGWTIRSGVVHEADEFDYDPVNAQLTHRPPRPGIERGPVIAAWARGEHKDGRVEIDVMDVSEIEKVRAVSRASERGPWVDWYERMAEKSPARRLFKKLPLADSDLERDRIRALLADVAPEPGDAQNLLYGPTVAVNELPAADPPSVDGSAAAAGQQADGAAQDTSPSETAPEPAPSAPGVHDDEPSLADEPVSAFVAPAGVDDDSITIAAQHAALFHPPNGAHKDMTLSEILAVGPKGEAWFRNRLEVVTEPAEYVQALWNFCRVYAPELFQAALAKREAEAA